MTDPIAAAWRERFLEALARECAPWPDSGLLLSGGIDSAVLLAGLSRLGQRPRCYSFLLEGVESDDLAAARRLARHFGVPLDVASAPRTYERLVGDVRDLVALVGPRKAAVQCAHPCLYLGRLAAERGERAVLIGTGGVSEDNKRVHLIVAAEGEDAARAYRAAKLTPWSEDPGTGTWAMHVAVRDAGRIRTIEPYAAEPVRSYQLSLDFAEVNRPRQKGIALRAFPELAPYWRRNSPLQVGTGVRAWHDELLADPEMNSRGKRSVVAVYNDVAAGRVPAATLRLIP